MYESIGEVLEALSRLRLVIDRVTLMGAMTDTGINLPFGDQELDELKNHLGLQILRINGREQAVTKVLASPRWRDTVVQARLRLGLPSNAISKETAEIRHDELLAATLGGDADHSPLDGAAIFGFWSLLVKEARPLAVMLSMDPKPIDRKIATFSPPNGVNTLIGVRKAINPKGVFKIEGQVIESRPTPADLLMAHILCGLPLAPSELPTGPTVSYRWERTADGGGRLFEEIFGFEQATASEIRELQRRLRWIKREFRARILNEFSVGGTWKDKWRLWNRLFPDLDFPSADAMRRAVAYQKDKDRMPNKKVKPYT